MRHVRRLPFGDVFLVAVAVGLAGYALWRLVQAVRRTEDLGTSPKGMYSASGTPSAERGNPRRPGVDRGGARPGAPAPGRRGRVARTGRLDALVPHGTWLVCAVGAVVIGVGVAQLVIAARASFLLKLGSLSEGARAWVTWLGRLGYVARGVVLFLIGGFLISAGIHANPRDARGIGGALRGIAHQPEGRWLFGAVALGLAAYGVFMLVVARYRRMVVR